MDAIADSGDVLAKCVYSSVFSFFVARRTLAATEAGVHFAEPCLQLVHIVCLGFRLIFGLPAGILDVIIEAGNAMRTACCREIVLLMHHAASDHRVNLSGLAFACRGWQRWCWLSLASLLKLFTPSIQHAFYFL